MYEKTNSCCLTMQKYYKKLNGKNLFNESPRLFSQMDDLYFVSNSSNIIIPGKAKEYK